APARPFIPGDLDRVQTGKNEGLPSFLGQKAQPVQTSRAPKKGPGFFERLTGGRRKETEEVEAAPQQRREPTVAQRAARPAPVEQRAPESLSPSTESRLVQPSHEEEQLEIPTFLRGQANGRDRFEGKSRRSGGSGGTLYLGNPSLTAHGAGVDFSFLYQCLMLGLFQ